MWSNLYEHGKAVMMKLQPTLTLLLAYTAWAVVPPVEYLPANAVARYRKVRCRVACRCGRNVADTHNLATCPSIPRPPQPILAAASALTISIVGFTAAMIMPLNKRMQKMESEASGSLPPTRSGSC